MNPSQDHARPAWGIPLGVEEKSSGAIGKFVGVGDGGTRLGIGEAGRFEIGKIGRLVVCMRVLEKIGELAVDCTVGSVEVTGPPLELPVNRLPLRRQSNMN